VFGLKVIKINCGYDQWVIDRSDAGDVLDKSLDEVDLTKVNIEEIYSLHSAD